MRTRLALKFWPAEIFSLLVPGLLLGMVGADVNTGGQRFTAGIAPNPMPAVMIGAMR